MKIAKKVVKKGRPKGSKNRAKVKVLVPVPAVEENKPVEQIVNETKESVSDIVERAREDVMTGELMKLIAAVTRLAEVAAEYLVGKSVSVKMAKEPAKKAEEPAKKAEEPAKKAEEPAKKAEEPAKVVKVSEELTKEPIQNPVVLPPAPKKPGRPPKAVEEKKEEVDPLADLFAVSPAVVIPAMTEGESKAEVVNSARAYSLRFQPKGVGTLKMHLKEVFKAEKITDLSHEQRIHFIKIMKREMDEAEVAGKKA